MSSISRKKSLYCQSKTIFIGNGLNRAFNIGCSWDNLLKKTEFCDGNFCNVPYFLMPRLNNLDLNECIKHLNSGFNLNAEYCSYIKSLVELGFRNFITTNYTYEIEYALLEPKKRNHKTIAKYSFSMVNERLDPQTSVSNFVQIPYNGDFVNVWHIHGEIRKPSSIVLDLNRYAMTIGRVFNNREIFKGIMKVNNRGYGYESYMFKSWVDLFLLNDLYFIAYGLDYSEIDIWWILEKRKIYDLRCKNSIYIYPSKKTDFDITKRKLLKNENVKVIDVSNSDDYKENYLLILSDLKKRVKN